MRAWFLGLFLAAVWLSSLPTWAADQTVEQPSTPVGTDTPQESAQPQAVAPGQGSVEQPNGSSSSAPQETPAPQSPGSASDQSANPANVAFTVSEYRIEGNTILPAEQLNRITAQHVGPERHVSDVEAARAALEKTYREAGYPTVIVAVPEQTIEDGVVRLTVIESKLGTVDVMGNRYFSTDQILKKLPSLRPGILLHEPTVVKELDSVNANPDRQVSPVLTTGKEPGTVDLQLKVADRLPLHGSLEWNNRGSPNTPRQRLNASIKYSNLFDRDQSVEFQTTQTPEKLGDVQAYSLNYVIPFTKPGNLVSLYAAFSNSQSALNGSVISVGDVGVSGNQTVIGARYFFPRVVSEVMNYQFSTGIDYKHPGRSQAEFPAGSFTQGQPLGGALVTRAFTYVPLSVAFAGTRVDTKGVTNLSASFKGYVAGLVRGGTEEDFAGDPYDPVDAPPARFDSTGKFWILQAAASRVQRLQEGFSLSAAVDGQLTNEPLVSSEQYYAGGVTSVRGYLENEAPGDNAIRWSVEVTTPEDRRLFPENTKGWWQLAVFYDEAVEYLLGLPSGQTNEFVLAGVGGGLRLKVTDYIFARMDQAWAVRSGPLTEKGTGRTHASLTIIF